MKRPIAEEKVRKILELYPTHRAKEIAAMLGIGKTAVNNYAKMHGIKHDIKLQNEIYQERIYNLTNPEKKEKKRQSQSKGKKHLFKMERLRVMQGLPQKTKVRISFLPRALSLIVSKYVHKYNYFRFEDEPYTLYYDSETRRTKTESYLTGKYGLKFQQADE